VSSQLYASAALTLEKYPPGTHWIGRWVGPIASQMAVRLSALRAGRPAALSPPWYPFLLEAE
jgi:hypothetical protein